MGCTWKYYKLISVMGARLAVWVNNDCTVEPLRWYLKLMFELKCIFFYLAGTIDSVLIKEVSSFPEVVLYTSLSSWDHRQCPD